LWLDNLEEYMKRTMKSLVVVTMGLLLLSSALFANGDKETSQEKPNIRVLSNVSGGKDDQENAKFQDAISKGTGLNITWEKVPANYDQVVMQKLGAGEQYDLVYLTQFQMYTLAKQGALLDLTDRIKNSTVYQENVDPSEIDKIRYNDKVYAGFNKLEVYPLVNVNKAVTDKLGIDLNSLDSLAAYEDMLVKVKDYMENTEGRKPYYPFYIPIKKVWDMQPWFSVVGARSGVYKDASGKKYAPFLEPNAEPVWTWLAGLYKKGLIDPASFTGSTGDMRKKMWQAQDIVLDSDWAAWTGLYNNNAKNAGTYPDKVNVIGLPGLKNPDGYYMLEQGDASLWAIPANAKHPDEAFKIIEYLATAEGGKLLTLGIEGYDYTMENGKVVLTDIGTAHSKDHGAPFPISKNFDLSLLEPMNPGTKESVAIGKRSDVKVATMGYANGELDAAKYKEILAKWMSECFLGNTDAATAMKNAKSEMKTAGLID